MRLDVIVPTYNRCELLRRTLASLRAATIPHGLEVRVVVVDNNSKDATRRLVEECIEDFDSRLSYIFEGRQGKSFALNTAIDASDADLIGVIDDDEEVDSRWYEVAREAFADEDVDFIGGPYKPSWSAQAPAWIPEGYPAVLGIIDAGERVVPYDEHFPGMLMGGNAVFRRSALHRAGAYATEIGRIGNVPMAGEDDDMYRRLLATGARGFYRPDLIIYHHIPAERLTKKYYRSWCFWRGVSCGFLDRTRPEPVAYLAGVPRYLYGQAAHGFIGASKYLLTRRGTPARAFSDELALWDLAGFFYGKHFYKAAAQNANFQPPAAHHTNRQST
jgi:glycosyltransferase involved in cell wall biosynthesis